MIREKIRFCLLASNSSANDIWEFRVWQTFQFCPLFKKKKSRWPFLISRKLTKSVYYFLPFINKLWNFKGFFVYWINFSDVFFSSFLKLNHELIQNYST